ncbi:MAG: hypothetical protein IRY97_01035 [Thermomicrobiaceae bacterium]|nr:hypothetical protein [Thermomicrobiaceae bacterium]
MGDTRSLTQVLEQRSIVDLQGIVERLDGDARQAFARLFRLESSVGETVPPEHMYRWIERYFGSVDLVRRQKVVKVTNRYTLEETLFNELRACRPLEARIPAELADEIARSAPDPFCEPELNTPADVFGRVRGATSITASNIAKYDGFHGVIIFDEHDPLAFTEESVADAIQVAQEWFQRCRQLDPSAVYPLVMWNCLWKSGASIPHGHAQMSLTRGMHYGKVERQRRAALEYRHEHGQDYFDDLYRVHEALGLGIERGDVRVMANVTPLKEKELVLYAPTVSDDLARMTYHALRCLVERLNVTSFNLVIWQTPLADTPEDWSGVPVTVRMVDRGDPLNRTSDFGAMELYAASVVSSDPFRVAEALWPCITEGGL